MQSFVVEQEERRVPLERTLGWVGTGRMGTAMASRLLKSGFELMVYNRTSSRTEALLKEGATPATGMAELSQRDVVFITVAGSQDLLEVVDGDGGLLRHARAPRVIVDCSTVSTEVSRDIARRAALRDAAFLCAPVSGNPKVAASGRLSMAVSGPRDAFEEIEPYANAICARVTYLGEGESARLVKLCHNLFLGVVIQVMAEVTVLAEKGGVTRSDFLEFLNNSVLGSVFSRYKSPALVNLDFAPTFTTKLLCKDFDLGLAAARSFEVPMPVSALVHEIVQSGIGEGIGEKDFAALLCLAARGAALELKSENSEISDGLVPVAK